MKLEICSACKGSGFKGVGRAIETTVPSGQWYKLNGELMPNEFVPCSACDGAGCANIPEDCYINATSSSA